MRAARLDELGGQPALGQADPPVRGPGQALVEVTVAGVNPVDLSIGSGRFYAGPPPDPLHAARVVAAGRSKERLQRAVELGADAAVELGDGAGLPDAFRAAFDGEGPTLIVDPLWGAPLVAALEAAANGVRVVQIGQSAGPEASIPSNFVRGKQTELLGYSNFAVPADVRRRTYLEMVAHATAGDLQIDLE